MRRETQGATGIGRRARRASIACRGTRIAVVVGVLGSGVTGSVAAQRWVDSWYPYITSGANDFPMPAAKWQWTRPVGDYFSPYQYNGSLSLDAGVSFNSSYFITAQFRAPGIRDGWRFAGLATISREARYGFFGIGNNTVLNQDLVNDDQPFYYRMRRKWAQLQAEVTRRVLSHVHVAGALSIKRNLLSDLPGPSVYSALFPRELKDTDLTGRLSLIFDSRDNEFNTTQGLLLESGALAGSGGNGYNRFYGVMAGYLPLREGTTIAARIGGAGIGGGPPLHAKFELPMWERTITVFGGDDTHRAFDEGRFTGEDVLFGNLEVRHNILDLQTIGALTAIAFVDGGRVFDGETFSITTDGLKWGGGGGLAIRLLRSTIFAFNLAKGDEGWNFTMNSGWLF